MRSEPMPFTRFDSKDYSDLDLIMSAAIHGDGSALAQAMVDLASKCLQGHEFKEFSRISAKLLADDVCLSGGK